MTAATSPLKNSEATDCSGVARKPAGVNMIEIMARELRHFSEAI
jgi:hypothetical protein